MHTWIAAGSSSTPVLMDSGKRCWVIATYDERARRAARPNDSGGGGRQINSGGEE